MSDAALDLSYAKIILWRSRFTSSLWLGYRERIGDSFQCVNLPGPGSNDGLEEATYRETEIRAGPNVKDLWVLESFPTLADLVGHHPAFLYTEGAENQRIAIRSAVNPDTWHIVNRSLGFPILTIELEATIDLSTVRPLEPASIRWRLTASDGD